jgi:hypothetical protein
MASHCLWYIHFQGRRLPGQPDDPVRIHVFFGGIGHSGGCLRAKAACRVCADQPQVTAGKPRQSAPGDSTHQWRQSRMGRKGSSQSLAVSRGPAEIGHHAGHADAGLQPGEAGGDCRQTAGHAVGVDHEYHRRVQPGGHLRRAAGYVVRCRAVEHSHDALDNGHIGLGGNPAKKPFYIIALAHPSVEVVAGPPGYRGKMPGIQKIRSHLECLDFQAPTRQGRHNRQGDGRLARSRVGAGNDDSGKGVFQNDTPFIGCATSPVSCRLTAIRPFDKYR